MTFEHSLDAVVVFVAPVTTSNTETAAVAAGRVGGGGVAPIIAEKTSVFLLRLVENAHFLYLLRSPPRPPNVSLEEIHTVKKLARKNAGKKNILLTVTLEILSVH